MRYIKIQFTFGLDCVAYQEIDEDGVVKEKTSNEHRCNVCNKLMVEENYRWCRSIRHYVRVYPQEESFEWHGSGLDRVQCRGPT